MGDLREPLFCGRRRSVALPFTQIPLVGAQDFRRIEP
jgi:hypothetical protein